MRKSIWKFKLDTSDIIIVEMPIGAEILTVQEQNDKPCLWALVNIDEVEKEKRTFCVYGTGHIISSNSSNDMKKYIGTYQLMGGCLVFHVFELIER